MSISTFHMQFCSVAAHAKNNKAPILTANLRARNKQIVYLGNDVQTAARNAQGKKTRRSKPQPETRLHEGPSVLPSLVCLQQKIPESAMSHKSRMPELSIIQTIKRSTRRTPFQASQTHSFPIGNKDILTKIPRTQSGNISSNRK